MTIAFSMQDNEDGSGATATISGTSGAANTVYYASMAVQNTVGLQWLVGGTRTGDGTINMAIPEGVFLAYLLTAPSTVSLPDYFTVTSTTDNSIQTRCRNAVMATIGLLPIPPAKNVYAQKWPNESNIKFPATLCTVDGVQETEELGLSTRDDVGYPVKVMFADRKAKIDDRDLPNYELWRLYTANAFRHQRVLGIPESKWCLIEEYVIVDPNAREFQFMVSALTIRCICRQPRGIGVL